MKYHDLLDLVLNLLSETKDDPETAFGVAMNDELGAELSGADWFRIGSMLEKDGFIEDPVFGSDYFYGRVTINGLIFIEKGGYVQQLRDIKAKNRRRRVLNTLVGGGAGLAGLYALWQMSKALLGTLFQCAC